MLACLGLGAVTPRAEQAPQQPPVFRTAADLVTIDVTVTVNGQTVGALTADDFLLTDNGVPQKIEIVDLAEIPAEVTLIVDASYMMFDTLHDMVPNVDRIVGLLRPEDRVRLMVIDTTVKDLVSLRARSDWPGVAHVSVGEQASVHDALASAFIRHQDPDRQHLILAITNGVDTQSVTSVESLRDLARRSRARLHIVTADLFLEGLGPENRKRYSTRWERLKSASVGFSSRMWRPHHDRAFNELEAIALATGGGWHMPGLFTDRNATAIFDKLYEVSRRSYRLRYVPTGVARDGWHDVSVTVPKYRGYQITARPGYAHERSAPPAPAPAPTTPTTLTTIDDIVEAYGRGDVTSAMQAVMTARDPGRLVDDYLDMLNPWPGVPRRESVFVLDFVYALLSNPPQRSESFVQDLIDGHRRVLHQPAEPDAFERYWLWSAAAITMGLRPGFSKRLVASALTRFPDEPRLMLMQAILIDRDHPGWLAGESRSVVQDTRSPVDVLGQRTFNRVIVRPLAPESHITEVLAAYDAAMRHADVAAEARVRKAWVLYRLSRPEEALTLLQAPGDMRDGTVEYLRQLFLGRTLESLGRTDEAREAYRAAVFLNPGAQSARVSVMRLAAMAGDRQEAESQAEVVQTSDGVDPWWIYWQGDFRMAAAALERMRSAYR